MGLVTQDSGPEFGSSSWPGEMHTWCAAGVLPTLGECYLDLRIVCKELFPSIVHFHDVTGVVIHQHNEVLQW